MKPLLFLSLFLLGAVVVVAQPFPLPQDGPPGASTTTYDAQGRRFETFSTPTGSVTYGPDGRYDTFKNYNGGTTTYGPTGEKWETFPGPSTPSPHAPAGR